MAATDCQLAGRHRRHGLVDRLFKAILPDAEANEFGPVRAVLVYLVQRIASLNPTVDVSQVLGKVEQLLDESVAANAYVIHAPTGEGTALIDLNHIDWETLAERFATGKKRTEAEKLRAAVAAKVARLAGLNPDPGRLGGAVPAADRRVQRR